MSAKKVVFDDDNPEWTEDDFARARPISDFPELAAVFPAAAQPASVKIVTLAIDAEVLGRFQATGSGWQRRVNEALRKAAGLPL